MDIQTLIRDIPDFPVTGVLFRDITPLLADPAGLRWVIDQLVERYRDQRIDKVVAVESRGFIFGVPVALGLGVGFAPARKPGKLPYKTIEESYTLEYGTNTVVMHEDAVAPGERVLIVDDLIATGGTLGATCKMVERLGGEVVEIATVIELAFLEGRKQLGQVPLHAMLTY